jgi:hypothetical protein
VDAKSLRSLDEFRKMGDAFLERVLGDDSRPRNVKRTIEEDDENDDEEEETVEEDVDSLKKRLEKLFWVIVRCPYGDVNVEYGADLHTSIHGR